MIPKDQVENRNLDYPEKDIRNKVFKSRPSKICGRQPLKNLKGYGLLSRLYPFKSFKGCLPQILLGLLLNTLFPDIPLFLISRKVSKANP